MNTRDQQKEKRREEILLAGLDLFVKKGYAATKTSDIAKAVNMSDGLLFHYFATKESLYEELIRIGTESSQAWMETDERSPLNFFTDVTNQILDMIRVNPQGAEFFVLIAQAAEKQHDTGTDHADSGVPGDPLCQNRGADPEGAGGGRDPQRES